MRAVPSGMLLLFLVVPIACGDGNGSAQPDGGDDVGPVDAEADAVAQDADPDASADVASDAGPPVPEGACNTLQPGDSFIVPVDSSTTASPAAQGGTLVSGVYHLASTTYYPARTCARDPVATALVVDAVSMTSGALRLATATAAGATFSESIRYASNGAFLSTRIDCFKVDPGGVQGSAALVAYTATATEIQLITNSPRCGVSVDSYQM